MFKNRLLIVAFLVSVVLLAVPAVTVFACGGPCPPPEVIGTEGCTPGYWKNHTESWPFPEISLFITLEEVFDIPDAFGLDNYTVLQALSFKGGPTIADKAQILLRAAAAAAANVGHADVDYPLTSVQLINSVNAALNSGSAATIISLAGTLDGYNNLGCPL